MDVFKDDLNKLVTAFSTKHELELKKWLNNYKYSCTRFQ